MQIRFFALSLLTSALVVTGWSQPMIEAAELPAKSTTAARPPTVTPLPNATSQPKQSGMCLTKANEPPPKREKTDKDPAVTLGQSFVIPKEVASDLSHIPAVSYRLDGEKLFTVTNMGQLLVWSNESKEIEQEILLTKEPLVSVVLDPKGCYAAWSTKSDFYLLALGERNPTKIKNLSPMSIALSADTVALAFKDKIEVRSLRDASLEKELKDFSGEITNMSFSPDGGSLGVTTKDGKLSLVQTSSYKVAKTVQKIGALHAIAFSPDSKFVSYGGDERIVYQMDVASYKEEVITQNQPFWITSLSYSPDGEFIAFGDESCDVWLFRRSDKKNLFHSKHHNECWLNSITWTPDSQAFIFGCRPNTYAGKPAIYMDNHYQEANNDGEVARLDKEIEANNVALSQLLQGEAMASYRKRFEEASSQQKQARSVTLNFNSFPNGAYLNNNGIDLNNISPNGGVSFNSINFAPNASPNNSLNFVNSGARAMNQNYEDLNKLFADMEKEPSLKSSVVALKSLNAQRSSNFDAKVKFLNESFCVNQWVVTR